MVQNATCAVLTGFLSVRWFAGEPRGPQLHSAHLSDLSGPGTERPAIQHHTGSRAAGDGALYRVSVGLVHE